MQKPTRIMERSSSMRKRTLEQQQGDGDGGQPEEKRPKVPALASVIVEALKVDSLQKLCSSLEPILRRVVSEEVERALAKLGPARISGRTSPKRIEGPDGRNLQLRFRSRLSLPLFTGGKVEGEAGSAVHVVLLDASTDQVVTSGLEACAKLDVVVLEGDFNNEDEEGWTQEDFESHVVKEREGKRPLLTGEVQVNLKEGVGTLGDFTFTDNSSWIRSRKFRLGLKVSSGYCEGIRIREAKTDAFTVKDHRGELYKKHYPPALHDEVWRLEKIGKDGSFHKRLNKAGIFSVEDFLRLVVRDPQRLRTILGSGMSNKMWDAAVEHAKTCLLSGKLYIYYGDDSRTVGVIFNNIYELSGLVAGDQYYSAEALSDSQKVYVDALVKKAYENWPHVVEYDGKALLSFKQNKKMASAKGSSQANQITSYQAFDQEVAMQRMPMAVNSDLISDSSVHGGATSSGYTDNSTIHYSANPQQLVPSSQIQFDTSAYASQEQVMNSQHAHATHSNTVGLELGAAQTSTSSFPSVGTSMQPGTINSHDDWSRHREQEFFTEEEIRMRSLEMLENEDMQQLLRLFSMGGGGMNMTDDAFAYSSYIPAPSPTFAFGEDRSRSSGRAVVGWLKLKAALRWGIFIRKIAAEKRAQLVELEDS